MELRAATTTQLHCQLSSAHQSFFGEWLITGSANALFGAKSIKKIVHPSMGGEDFARYVQAVPGAMFFLRVGNAKLGAIHTWHHPKFRADEDAIPIGAAVLAKSATFLMMSSANMLLGLTISQRPARYNYYRPGGLGKLHEHPLCHRYCPWIRYILFWHHGWDLALRQSVPGMARSTYRLRRHARQSWCRIAVDRLTDDLGSTLPPERVITIRVSRTGRRLPTFRPR